MHSEPDWAAATTQFQQALGESWSNAIQSLARVGETDGATVPAPRLSFSPEKLAALQQAYLKEAAGLWNHGLAGVAAGDKRFASEDWGSNPVAAFSAATYLLNGRTLLGLVEATETDPKTKAR
ncbi:MAG: class I poly(R)-hydroxyalkanoic acid synthase, partial [Ramlibacter sp.]